MGFLHTFLTSMGVCAHPQTYRERRDLDGVGVLHFVCEDCGHAVPAVQRTAEEHRRVVETGAIRPATVYRHRDNVVAVSSRCRRPVATRFGPAAGTGLADRVG